MNPLDYSLCSQTVTVYRNCDGEVRRRVAGNCHLTPQAVRTTETAGKSLEKCFQLIIPGAADLQPGDRVYDGIGPEQVQWAQFIPALEEKLYEISFVKPCYWEGEVTHVQAGHR